MKRERPWNQIILFGNTGSTYRGFKIEVSKPPWGAWPEHRFTAGDELPRTKGSPVSLSETGN